MVDRKRDELHMTPAALGAALEGDMTNFLVAATPGGIEAQEAAGQAQLVSRPDRLPIRGTIDDAAKRAQWEAVGFTFGEPINDAECRGRPIFVACAFPEGWSLKPTEHSMWSHVLDATGSKRASVFFKAAFYDYNAHTFGLEVRYRITSKEKDDKHTLGVYDEEEKRFIHVFGTFPDFDSYYAAWQGDREKHQAWLTEHFPDHSNPMAYWT